MRLALLFASSVVAHTAFLSSNAPEFCTGLLLQSLLIVGIYYQAGSSNTPAITVTIKTFTPFSSVSLLAYNSRDAHLLFNANNEYTLCTQALVTAGACSHLQIGLYIVGKGEAVSAIKNEVFAMGDSNGTPSFMYLPLATGYYCFMMVSDKGAYTASLDVVNPFGLLPAIEYPKLPFYGALSLVYLSITVAWLYLSFIYRQELLKMQHILTGITLLVLLETSLLYGYYSYYNTYGDFSPALLGFSVVLNSARNAASFFVLLIVGLGYGVVKHELGSTMKKCIVLAVAHLIFGVLYMSGSLLYLQPGSASLFIFVLPLSTTMTIFYYWTLNALEATILDLKQRQQNVKLDMYRTLSRILLASAVVMLVFFAANSVYFYKRNEEGWIHTHWMYKWIVLDGWLNLLYLFVFCAMLWIWRPTRNNQRYGLTELSQDDAGSFEESFGGSDEALQGVKMHTFSQSNYGQSTTSAFNKHDEEEDDVMGWAESKFGYEEGFESDAEDKGLYKGKR